MSPEREIDEDRDDDAETIRPQTITRSGRLSKPFDFEAKCPETAHVQVESADVRRWLKPCCFDDQDFTDKLGEGTYYQDSYFAEGTDAKEME